MNRKQFIKLAGLSALSIPMISTAQQFKNFANQLAATEKMPLLFLGHGSPMNAIEDNEFVQGFKKQGQSIQKPQAILVISAHWETNGTKITGMEKPKTIHDFRGFPKELFEVQYPAPGHPELAKTIADFITPEKTVVVDHSWGLDHGTWSVIKHLYPEANVPVIQLSINYNLSPQEHYDLAKQLKSIRTKGVLIVGSGNLVHNLGAIAWDKINEYYAYDWAKEASDKMKNWILTDNHQNLIDFRKQGKAFVQSIPTPEHYLPLLYALALKEENDQVTLFNDQPLAGSLTMTSMVVK